MAYAEKPDDQDSKLFGAKKRPATTPAEFGPTKSSSEGIEGDIVFNLRGLHAAASDAKILTTMNLDALARTVAAATINFEEYSRPCLPVLSNCLRTVFGSMFISGDLFVEFPEAKLFEMVVDALRKDAIYVRLGENATLNLEWRLQRFLQRLRL